MLPIESSKRPTILIRIFQRDVSNLTLTNPVKKQKIKSSIRINEEKI